MHESSPSPQQEKKVLNGDTKSPSARKTQTALLPQITIEDDKIITISKLRCLQSI